MDGTTENKLHPRVVNGILKRTLWSPLKTRGISPSKEDKAQIINEILDELYQSDDVQNLPALLTWLAKRKRASIVEEHSINSKAPVRRKTNALGEEVSGENVFELILGGINESTSQSS